MIEFVLQVIGALGIIGFSAAILYPQLGMDSAQMSRRLKSSHHH